MLKTTMVMVDSDKFHESDDVGRRSYAELVRMVDDHDGNRW
ncbi:hypothetical protein Hanom_Chr07g00592361 [Helianthus anomalus]